MVQFKYSTNLYHYKGLHAVTLIPPYQCILFLCIMKMCYYNTYKLEIFSCVKEIFPIFLLFESQVNQKMLYIDRTLEIIQNSQIPHNTFCFIKQKGDINLRLIKKRYFSTEVYFLVIQRLQWEVYVFCSKYHLFISDVYLQMKFLMKKTTIKICYLNQF